MKPRTAPRVLKATVESLMKNADKVIKESVRRASAILAEYVGPGKRDCEATIERL